MSFPDSDPITDASNCQISDADLQAYQAALRRSYQYGLAVWKSSPFLATRFLLWLAVHQVKSVQTYRDLHRAHGTLNFSLRNLNLDALSSPSVIVTRQGI